LQPDIKKNDSMPKVSVIMPAYNAETFIREAIDSILAQSHRDFELVILDDGSMDATASIVQSYDDPRIRLIQKDNEGVAATLNRGIGLAQGEFIWRHDADDISTPERLEKQIRFLNEHPDVLLCSTQIAFMTERGRIAKNKKQPKDQWFEGLPWKRVGFKDFNPFSPITHATILARASILRELNGYRTQFKTAEDIDLWLRMMELGKMVVLNECTYQVRLSRTSATAVHGWKNEFYRELAKTYWKQRREGKPDDLEVHGSIVEPEAPIPTKPARPVPGKTFRSDLLNFHYAVHIDAGDWREVARIIRHALADGWRLKRVFKAILIPLLPSTFVKAIVSMKSRSRQNPASL